jgi:hypothetical protein
MATDSPLMGLKIWNSSTDPYDHAQLAANWGKVDEHDHSSGKGTQIPTGGIRDGAITAAKLSSDVLGPAGLVSGLSTATTETTTSTSYTTLTTADSVSVTVGTNGLLRIAFRALWKLTAASNDGSIALFLGSQQLQTYGADNTPANIAGTLVATGDNYGFVGTSATGFTVTASPTSDSALITTGISLNPLTIDVAAGTYTVSVKYKVNAVSGGTLSVKERKLWAWTDGGF